MTIHLHQGDLPSSVDLGDLVAVDTETLGLNPHRDQLCVVQLSAGDGDAHLVQLDRETYDAPNLVTLMADRDRTKIFHYARFDLGMIGLYLNVMTAPVYCTKIASKLARTYTDKHGLKDICKEILGKDLSKASQSSDWGAKKLSKIQQEYAAGDVLYLHKIKQALDVMLEREGRTELAEEVFACLPARVALDLAGWADEDIFAH